MLLLGPLYHLPERADRLAAWREAARVVRPGGVVMAATISRFASLLDGFVKGYVREPQFAQMLETTLATGEHQPPEGTPWFTTAYFHHPDELPGEEEDFNTLGGFVMHTLGRIPVVTDAFVANDYRYEVLDMDGNRVDKILVTHVAPPAAAATAVAAGAE